MDKANWTPLGGLYDIRPLEVPEETREFPYEINNLLPPPDYIPSKESIEAKWFKLFADLFFNGTLTVTKMIPKSGVQAGRAWTHLTTIAKSQQPNYEYKEAAFAYLASVWFEEIGYVEAT